MSMIYCFVCEEYIDSDYEEVFYHKWDMIFCGECARELGCTEPDDGEFCG